MSKMSEMAMTIEELRNAAAAITDAANYLAQLFSGNDAEEQPEEKAPVQKPALTLEQVRAVLSEKSRAGYTAGVRELLQKYGASKLSQVDPANYEALLRDAEVIGKPEMAEVKGKRLLIAAEMQEGSRLNDSTVKQLCSTDDVFAEKKYKDPFSFKPCHTLVLYTNHLPRVSASDDGIWRRLIVIPFNAKITGKSDIKNYGEYLFDNAGESILAWVIEGAKKVIELDYQIPVPACVQKAIDEYRNQNDWFGHFLADKCEVDDSYKESSSALYQAYRNYSMDCNEYIRSTADFYFALEKAGFERIKVHNKRYFKGLRLRADDSADEDFLN